eukprot:TRINITY_DN27788_c0_g1_i1.p1 TRINITY_DN27788_c0_g1~~TRINITY_DN27788_c0_g1_i1.p1  ORF type:complete len:804 (+),score=168.89 TRINITY_DN27788_c0_g1_i1:277-2688(+)
MAAADTKKLFAERVSVTTGTPAWIQVRLSGRALGDEHMAALAKYLDALMQKEGVSGSSEVCANVELAENSIGSTGLASVLDALEKHKVNCKCLKLYKNRIGDDGGIRLAKMVANQTSCFEEIHLSHNVLTQRSLIAICMAMGKHEGYPQCGRNRMYVPCWLRMEYNHISRPLDIIEMLKRDGDVSICTAENRDFCGPWRCYQSAKTSEGVPKVHLYTLGAQSRNFRPANCEDAELREEIRRFGGKAGAAAPSVRRAPGGPAAPPGAPKAPPKAGASPTVGRGWGTPASTASTSPWGTAPAGGPSFPEMKDAGAEADRQPNAAERTSSTGTEPPADKLSTIWDTPTPPPPPTQALPAPYTGLAAGAPKAPPKAFQAESGDAPPARGAYPEVAPPPATRMPPPAKAVTASKGPLCPPPPPAKPAARVVPPPPQPPKPEAVPPPAAPPVPQDNAPAQTATPPVQAPAKAKASPVAAKPVKETITPTTSAPKEPVALVNGKRGASVLLDSSGKRRIHPDQLEGSDGSFVCPLCGFVMLKPIMSVCSHLFCSGCFQTYVERQVSEHKSKNPGNVTVPKIQCPQAGCERQLMKKDLSPLDKMDKDNETAAKSVLVRLRNNLRVRCVHHIDLHSKPFGKEAKKLAANKQDTCCWIGDLSAYDDHLSRDCVVEKLLAGTANGKELEATEKKKPEVETKKAAAAAAAPAAAAAAPAAKEAAKAPAPASAAAQQNSRPPTAIAEGGEVRVARFDYTPQEEGNGQICLKAQDLVKVFEITESGWAAGIRLDRKTREEVGKPGWFPAAYLTPEAK